mmetsp:Transcript_100582/g.260409  ORF Transcript_100582/g.260409 Transcript_100582/m.260409 type:complete len:211 (+) Transcript_100582:1968-2600(+)
MARCICREVSCVGSGAIRDAASVATAFGATTHGDTSATRSNTPASSDAPATSGDGPTTSGDSPTAGSDSRTTSSNTPAAGSDTPSIGSDSRRSGSGVCGRRRGCVGLLHTHQSATAAAAAASALPRGRREDSRRDEERGGDQGGEEGQADDAPAVWVVGGLVGILQRWTSGRDGRRNVVVSQARRHSALPQESRTRANTRPPPCAGTGPP